MLSVTTLLGAGGPPAVDGSSSRMALIAAPVAAAAPPAMAPSAESPDEDWSERLADEPVATIVQALGRSHAEVRDAVGPHRLAYESSYSLQPQPAAEALPPIDGTVSWP